MNNYNDILFFIDLKSTDDFVDFLNAEIDQSSKFKSNENISKKAFRYYSSPAVAKKRYESFSVKKKSGGQRIINTPAYKLKKIQEALLLVFEQIYQPHPAANGFVSKRSVIQNAKPHIGQNYVFNIDLKDFFSSIDQARIWKRLQYPPFNFNRKYGNLEIANRIAALVCTEIEVERTDENGNFIKTRRNVLPQGAPTSPIISNIIAHRLDYKLTGLANRFGLNYTRYADDITFSSKHNVYQKEGNFFKELERIIHEQNFQINYSKVRLQKRGYRQEVTGITVNEKANVKKRYIKQLRMWLSYWEKYGYDRAEEIFLRDYFHDKQHLKKKKPSLSNVVEGKLLYLKMVKGEQDPVYTKLSNRFYKLRTPQTKLVELLNVWENYGIEAAMNHFTRNK
jgi:retron-type reverse transcriptase